MTNYGSTCLAVALLILTNLPSKAQDPTDVTALLKATKVVVVEGPYQYQDGSGLVGYVVARVKHQVDFKPCGGDVISTEDSKLKKVSIGCGSEPSDDPNEVLRVDCPSSLSTAKLADLAGDSTPTGKVFADVHAGPITDQNATTEWRKAFEALSPAEHDCGTSVIFASQPNVAGFGSYWVGIVKPVDALVTPSEQ